MSASNFAGSFTGASAVGLIPEDQERPSDWRDIVDPGDGAPYFFGRQARRDDVFRQLRRAVRWHLEATLFNGNGTTVELLTVARAVLDAEKMHDPAKAVAYLTSLDESAAVMAIVLRIADVFDLAIAALTSIDRKGDA